MKKSSLAERDGELINNWYIACTSKELKSGKLYRSVIYDIPLLLHRDGNKVICLEDRCLHRHAPLSEGTIVDGDIMCPYHGWTFNKEGVLINIPSEGSDFVKGKAKRCIRRFHVVEQDECIWVWMGTGDPESNVPSWRFPYMDEDGWTHYFMITDFDNEVTHLAENFMDVPHTVYVHKGWFRNKSFKKVPMKVETFDGSVLVTYDQPDDGIGVLIKPILNPKNEPMEHTDHFFFPNITRVDYRFGENYQYVINSQCTPVSTMKSRVYTYIAYKLPFVGKMLKPFIHFYTRQVIEQDVDIMEMQSRNLKLDNKENFQSTPADELHVQIERLRKMGRMGNNELWKIKKEVLTDIWI